MRRAGGEEGVHRVALIHRGRIRAEIMFVDGRGVTTREMTAGQITAVTAMRTHGSPAVSLGTR